MHRLSLAASLLMTLAMPAGAEPVEIPLETPGGTVDVVDGPDGFTRYLTVGDRRFFEEDEYAFVQVEEQVGSLLLVTLSQGGNACPAQYVWLHTDADDVRVSETFGTCSDTFEVSSDAETLTVTLPSLDATEGFVAFDYDGNQITERVVGQEASISGPDAGAEPWIGQYPHDLFRASDWRGPLVALMGEEAYARAGATIELSGPMEAEGDWVAGAGCVKIGCETVRGAVAIHRGDGRLLVALRTPEAGLEVYGDEPGELPPSVQDVIEAE
jgi:hypothetical protein